MGGLLLSCIGQSIEEELCSREAHLHLRRCLQLAVLCAQSVEELHAAQLVHCDIATRNFLVEDRDGKPHVVICDLGLCRRDGSDAPNVYGLCPELAPPEFE